MSTDEVGRAVSYGRKLREQLSCPERTYHEHVIAILSREHDRLKERNEVLEVLLQGALNEHKARMGLES